MITKTIMTLGIMASFVIGISFSSVYAGVPWDTAEIADDAITSDKIKNKQVKNADIRGNTIKSGKIRDGTITSADLAPGVAGVPIGTVLDWWCSADCTIPDGFVIADGQLISDAASPFNGENVPDLTDTFIRGVTNVGNVGNTGGTSTHSHSHNHPVIASSSAGAAHTHSHDHGITGTSNNNGNHVHAANPPSTTSSSDTHNHEWALLGQLDRWDSYNSAGTPISLIDWTNGMDSDGSGHYPLGLNRPLNSFDEDHFYTDNDQHTHSTNIATFNTGSESAGHGHSVNLPNQVSTNGNANHQHNVNLPNQQSSTDGNEPPWYGLVKIIRIK